MQNKAKSKTLVNCLTEWAKDRPKKIAFSFLNENGDVQETLSFEELDRRARCIATHLQSQDLIQQPIILFFSSNIGFISAFLGCIYAGAIAIPIPPPQGKRQSSRVKNILVQSAASHILTTKEIRSQLTKNSKWIEDLNPSWISYEEALDFQGSDLSIKEPSEDQIAFLQYTSGSTSMPKGAIISHGNLIQNEEQIAKAFKHDSSTVVVGWLPFYHDMGLIGNILQPLYLGATAFLMSPTSFLQNPLQWLQAISRYRGTTSGGPNFAYDLCFNHIQEQNLKGLDLSSWKIAFNGSEFIRPKTLTDFAKKFEVCCFNSSSLYPCYGLAEATLFVTGCDIGNIHTRSLHLEAENRKLQIVGCGTPQHDSTIKIINPQTFTSVKEGDVGEIWLKGTSIAKGYWNLPNETSEYFNAYTQEGLGPFLRTGDLGLIDKGELYLVGRLKNLIIIRGKNFYPHDIENCLISDNEFLKGCTAAAFSVSIENQEELVVIIELDRKKAREDDFSSILKFIKQEISQSFQINPYAVHFVRPGGIPRTTSGKIQHHLCRQMFLDDSLPLIFKETEISTSETFQFDSFTTSLAKILSVDPQKIQEDEMLIHYGLDSLKAIQLQSWLKKFFNIFLPLETLFDGLTIRGILEMTSEESKNSVVSVYPTSSLTTAPLSYNQREVWLAHQIKPDRIDYHIPIILNLKGSFDRLAFIRALQDLSKRHPILKTVINAQGSELFQSFHDDLEPSLLFEDYLNLPEEDKSKSFQKSYRHLVETPFQLDKESLWRIRIFAFSPQEYVIVFNFHHIICDGGSMKIFAQELLALYDAHLKEKQFIFPDLEHHYFHFSAWQEQFSRTDEWTQLKLNWKNYLSNLDDDHCVLTLSHEAQPKQYSPNKNGKNIQIRIEETLLNEIQRFLSESHSTLACFLLSAYHTLLHRYSGQPTILVGYPSANRSHFETQEMLGFFVNTLVNKTTYTEHTTFGEVLQQVKEGLHIGLKNEALPFQEILKAVNPKRIENIHPLFQVMFVMQNAPVEIHSFPHAKVEVVHPSDYPVLYDLVLEVRQKINHIDLIFEYREESLSSFIVEQFSKDYLSLIKQVLLHLSEPLQTLQFISPNILQKMNSEWNSTFAPLPKDETIFDLIKQQAEQHPEAIAVIAEGKELTYRELIACSERIARVLSSLKEREEELVAISMEKTLFLIPTLLAIMQCGCAYVPLDPHYPQERIESIIKEANINILVSQQNLLKRLSFFKGKVIDLDHLPEDQYKTTHDITRFKSSLAYVLFTSGSTGKPKGVAVEHHSLLNFALAGKKLFEMNETDRCLQFASISWDTSSEEIYPCLLAGGIVILRGNAPVEPFDNILELSHRYQISVWNFPTSYWHDLTDYLIRKNITLPHSLRLLIVGGEHLNKQNLRKWKEQFGTQVKLLNTYGATETTSISCACDLTQFNDIQQNAVPIGKPIQNVRCYIFNSNLQSVPIGVPGELYIGGNGVARGYANLPELTQSRFFFHPDTKEKIYKTGDKAYYDKNGMIFLLGRLDEQIKRRGFRIEPEEIQSHIAQLEEVDKCLIVCQQDEEQNSSRIAAFIIQANMEANPNQDKIIPIIKDKLGKKIPAYLMPDTFILIKEFPRLPNGKIDYPSLHMQFKGQRNTHIDHLESDDSELNVQMLGIWKTVLQISIVKPHDSFFEVGGNSLLILKLHQLIQEKFNHKINITDLFIHHTYQAQVKMIENLQKKNSIEYPVVSPDKMLDLLKQLASGEIDSQTVKNHLIH